MKKFFIILNSTIFMVLFYFSDVHSLPLTRSCYTPPEDRVDLALKEEFIYIDNMNRKDNFSFNLGLQGDYSIGFDFSLIHYNSYDTGISRPGDILFNLWHFTGNYFDGYIDSGINIVMRIPTGPDAYTSEMCRNLSLGNSELKITPAVSINLTGHEVLLLNLSYIFREAGGENLYSGFKINPAQSETFKSCFGLNPFYKDSFVYHEKLKNDYISVSGGFLTSRLLPCVLFAELYYSTGVYKGDYTREGGNIEGNKVNPLLSSIGIKYFFSDSFFIQGSEVVNFLQMNGYIKNTTEFTLNIFF